MLYNGIRAKADELRTELELILGSEVANKVYNHVKAEANAYSIVEEINRMNDIVALAKTGISVDKILNAAANRHEKITLFFVKQGYIKVNSDSFESLGK